MVLIYLGYGTTNSNGVAKLDHDANGDPLSHSYTGVGAGELDVLASLDNPVVEGSVVSQPSTVLDTVKWDKGILNDPDTHDIYDEINTSRTLFERTNSYSRITEVDSSTTAVVFLSNIPLDCVVDFEYFQADGTTYNQTLGVYAGSVWKKNFSLTNIGGTTNNWINLRFSFAEGSVTLTNLDDLSKTYTQTLSGTPNRINWNTADTCSEIRIRNVKVYPI